MKSLPYEELATLYVDFIPYEGFDGARAMFAKRLGDEEALPQDVQYALFLFDGQARAKKLAPAPTEPTEADDATPLAWTPLPLDALPAPVRDQVQAHAYAIGCDPAFIAIPALAAVAAAIGNAAKIVLKETWSEPSTLWTGVVAPSGSAKSPAQDAALVAVFDLEREAAREYEREREAYEEAVAAQKRKKATSDDRLPPPPLRRRFKLNNVTTESLLLIHADNPRGLFWVFDELAGLMLGLDRYSKGGKGDAQTVIELHNARAITVDRKSNIERPVLYVERPAVPITGGIQPGMLGRVLRGEHFDSGFVARFLFASPPSRPLTWRPSVQGASHEVEEGYKRAMRALYALPAPQDDRGISPVGIGLSEAAETVFGRFHGWAMRGMSRMPDTSPLRPVWSKSPATCARLALCLELCTRAGDGGLSEGHIPDGAVITRASMENAALLTKWFLREALRLYRRFGFGAENPTSDEARVRLLPDPFTRDDVARVWGIKDPSTASKRINKLQLAGLVRKEAHSQYRRAIPDDVLTGDATDLDLLTDVRYPAFMGDGQSGHTLPEPAHFAHFAHNGQGSTSENEAGTTEKADWNDAGSAHFAPTIAHFPPTSEGKVGGNVESGFTAATIQPTQNSLSDHAEAGFLSSTPESGQSGNSGNPSMEDPS